MVRLFSILRCKSLQKINQVLFTMNKMATIQKLLHVVAHVHTNDNAKTSACTDMKAGYLKSDITMMDCQYMLACEV